MAGTLTETATGAVVLVAAVSFALYGGKLAGWGASGGTYPLTASFRSAEGITIGTDVKLAGVKVGAVTGLKLNPDSFYADTVLTIDETIGVPDDSEARIASEGLLGGSFVELMPGGSLTNYKSGAEIELTQGSVSLMELLLKYVGGKPAPASDAAGATDAGQ